MSTNEKNEWLNMNRSWKWLLYIDIVLPLLLFLVALLPIAGISSSFSRLFLTYNLYILNTIPNLTTFTGILGLAAHVLLIGWAGLGRRWIDMVICIALAAAVTLYFYFGLNYQLVGLLNFGI
jgi:hypothetical protein